MPIKLLKFGQQSCVPCQALETFLKNYNLPYTSIDAFDKPELARMHKIRSLPTLIVLDGEKEIARGKGLAESKIILDKFKDIVIKNNDKSIKNNNIKY